MKKQKKAVITSKVAFLYLGAASILFAALALLFALLGFFGRYGIAYWMGVISILLFGACFRYENEILILEDQIIVVSTPFHAGKEYYQWKKALVDWNCVINFSDIEKVELVNLTPDECMEYYGTHTIWNQFLKVDIKNSERSKFIYISIYTKKQLNRLLDIINSKKKPLEEEKAEN